MKALFLTLVMLGSSLSSLQAQDYHLPRGTWWEIPKVVEHLKLTPEQQQQISDLVYDHAQRMIGLNAGVESAKLALSREVESSNFDPARVRTAFDAFQDARSKLERERFEMLLSVRQVLSYEQWKKLDNLRKLRDRKNNRGDFRGPRPPRPPRPSAPGNPGGPR